MSPKLLLYPMFTHLVWVVFLYVLLTVFRAPSIWNIGAKKDGSNPWSNIEPRVSANLSNQFEWSLFFYVISLLIIILASSIEPICIWLAWLFVVGRFIHSGVQILTTNIRLRGVVFTINFLAVLGMWSYVYFKHLT